MGNLGLVGSVQSRIEDFGGLIRSYVSYFAFVELDNIDPCYLLIYNLHHLESGNVVSQSLSALTSGLLNDSGYKFNFLTVMFAVYG
jgi:hypothetical protein